MTGFGAVFVSAPGLSARTLAETFVVGLGVTPSRVASARFHTAGSENPAFAIPPGTDYHGFEEHQGLPVWVRVGALDENYRAQTLADYHGYQDIDGAVFGATHLIRLVYSYGTGAEDRIAAAVDGLAREHPLAWLDDDAVMHRSGPHSR